MLGWLRTHGRLAPVQDVREAVLTPVEQIERRYQSFLHNDRGLSTFTINNYLRWLTVSSANDFLNTP